MISDILFEAELEIRRYLSDMPDGHDVPGEPTLDQVLHLVQLMRAVRTTPASPLDNERLG